MSAFQITRSAEGLALDLPVDSRVYGPWLAASSESSLAKDGTVRITVIEAGKAPAGISIRQPDWAGSLEIRLNGVAARFPLVNGYVSINRLWAAGDVIHVKYGMQLKSQPCGKDRIAYSYGPWLLGAPASDNPAYFNELTVDNHLVQGKEEALAAARQPARRFTVPIAAAEVPFVPAEYADQPEKVVLRAIAEQTGQPPTAWELRFLTYEKS
jgi:DUF1680 family protein